MNRSDLQKVEAMLPISEATRRRNLAAGGGVEGHAAGETQALALNNIGPARRDSRNQSRPARRFRQRSKPLLNKLETSARDFLRLSMHPTEPLYEQAIQFRLANGLTYRPDLVEAAPHGSGKIFQCYECKGPWSPPTGIAKFKMAATQYPMCRWILMWKDAQGQWQTQEAKP